ncbi:MAG: PepSY domain-containing protein [Pseudomonadota bacterium]
MIYDGPLEAGEGAPTADQIAKINAMLAEMQCEMDDDDIELEDGGGFELDDVICAEGGQFDIDLDADFNVIGRRAE